MRRKLSEIYQAEREDICNKILKILDLKEDNSILLCDLDEDIIKQQAILALKEDIQKYFACSSINSFNSKIIPKRAYLNIVRGILRQQGYTFETGNTFVKIESGIYKKATKYNIFRD